MNILFASTDGPPTPNTGGGNKVIYLLIKEFSNKGHKISFSSYRNIYDDLSIDSLNNLQPSFKRHVTNYFFYNYSWYKK